MNRAPNADWLTAVVYQTVYHRYDNIYFYCSNYVGNQFIIAVSALIASCLRTALSHGILAIYHPQCLIAPAYYLFFYVLLFYCWYCTMYCIVEGANKHFTAPFILAVNCVCDKYFLFWFVDFLRSFLCHDVEPYCTSLGSCTWSHLVGTSQWGVVPVWCRSLGWCLLCA